MKTFQILWWDFRIWLRDTREKVTDSVVAFLATTRERICGCYTQLKETVYSWRERRAMPQRFLALPAAGGILWTVLSNPIAWLVIAAGVCFWQGRIYEHKHGPNARELASIQAELKSKNDELNVLRAKDEREMFAEDMERALVVNEASKILAASSCKLTKEQAEVLNRIK